MKFEYDEEQDRGECVAYVTHMNDNPDKTILVVKTITGSVWHYYDGSSSHYTNVSGVPFNPNGAIRKFYPGDKITITF